MRTSIGKRVLAVWLALAALACCAACSVSSGAEKLLVINEVVSSNKRSYVDEALGSPDWIELYNGSDVAIDISGCALSDNLRNLKKYVFPDGTVIDSHGYLLVFAADNGGAVKSDALCTGFGLSKNGDFLFLTDGYDQLLAELQIPALRTDVSYARRADGSYGYSALPTPGAVNADDVADSLDALFAGRDLAALVISEVMPTADESGYAWVELHNTGSAALALENYCLSDSSRNLMRWQFPASTLAPGGYVSVYLSGLDGEAEGLHASFKLGKTDAAVYLSDLQETLLDEMHWDAGVPKGVSVVRGDPAGYCAYPTFEQENSTEVFSELTLTPMDESDPVRINEVQKYNKTGPVDEDGDRSEWAELKNFTDRDVSLHGYFLSDDPDDLYKWALPDVSIPANGYLVIYLSGKNRIDPSGALHASFRLGDTENALYLTRLDGMRTEHMPLDALNGRNISVGLDGNGQLRYFPQPTPGYQNGNGFELADTIGFFNVTGVFISEVCATTPAKSGKNDWIELYNGGAEAVDLAGWHLSDDPDEPQKWEIPAGSIEAGGYLVIEATSHASRQKEGVAPFGVSGAGETLLLTDARGAEADRFSTGALENGVTSGRVETDATIERVFFTKATRGERNSDAVYTGYAPTPTFSDTALYHSEPFTVTLRCDSVSAQIYYTTDGSEPTAKSNLYTEPLTVSENTALRAVSTLDGKLISPVATADYIFDEPHTIPVVCIDGNPNEVRTVLSATNSAEKVEREVTAAYYEANGALGVRFVCGMKPKGAGTLAYAQKSLSLNLRAGYGQSEVSYPFVRDYEISTFSSLMLRNGGQDIRSARIRDAFCQNLVRGLHVDNTPTRPVAVYINGAYWGLYDFGEDQTSEYLEGHYGADGDLVDIIRRNEAVIKGSNRDFLRVRAFALYENLRNDEVFEQFSQWVDVEYFTDYLIAECFLCNSDMFNQKYWRAQDYSVKWRPIFYDLDFGYTTAKRTILYHFFSDAGVPSADLSLTYFDIYVGLHKNKAWRLYCAERYVELIMTTFSAANATALFDEMVAEIEPEMPRQIARWRQPQSMSHWRECVALMRRYIEQRPEYELKNVKSYFGISSAQMQEWIEKYTPVAEPPAAEETPAASESPEPVETPLP